MSVEHIGSVHIDTGLALLISVAREHLRACELGFVQVESDLGLDREDHVPLRSHISVRSRRRYGILACIYEFSHIQWRSWELCVS